MSFTQFITILVIITIYNIQQLYGESGIVTHFGGYNGVPQSTFPYGNYAAAGGNLWNNGYQCGACYKITCTAAAQGGGCGCTDNPTVIIQIMDWCPECRTHRPDVDFDLSTDTKK
eukprot:797717_1